MARKQKITPLQFGDVVRVINPRSPMVNNVGTIVKISGNRAIVDFYTHNIWHGQHYTVFLSSLERSDIPAKYESWYLRNQRKYYLIVPNDCEWEPQEETPCYGEYRRDEKPECGEMVYDVYHSRKEALDVAMEWANMYRGESYFRISLKDDPYQVQDIEVDA